MKTRKQQIFALLIVLLMASCATKHDSCGAYNRGGGNRGQVEIK